MDNIVYSGDCLMTGTLRFYTSGQIGVSTTSHNHKQYKNKYIYLDSGVAYEAFNRLATKTYISPDYCAGDKIWIHPKARVSRDLVRKSGYAITRDKDKAEFVVLPEPDYNEFCDISYNIACLCGSTPYFFTVSDVYNREIPDDKFEDAKERIKQYLGGDILFLCDGMSLKKACFLPALEEYADLLNDVYEDKSIIVAFDTKIQLVPNVDINVETLDVWARLDDMNMLSRFICASDWKDYPLTLKLFLESTHYGIKYQTNNNIKMIVKELGIGEKKDNEIMVTPKDYNMMMSWVFHLIGKPVGSTYITEKDWDNIPGAYKKFLKKRVAISPVFIKDDALCENIINMAKN